MPQSDNIAYLNVDQAYLDLVEHVLKYGHKSDDRTGVGTRKVFAYSYKLDLGFGFPLLQSKKVSFRNIVAENLWFLSGDPNIQKLWDQGIHFWDDWADDQGRLETAYGRYWRYFPVVNNPPPPFLSPSVLSMEGERFATLSSPYYREHPDIPGIYGFDQIQWIVDTLKTNPNSRRMVLTAWHPQNAMYSKLPACHFTAVFNVLDGELNCHLTQRSADIALGVPYNIAGYAFLTHLLAQEAGLQVGEFSHTLVDAHIYNNHVDGLKEQLSRRTKVAKRMPELTINENKSLDDWELDDFWLHFYEPEPAIKFDIAV